MLSCTLSHWSACVLFLDSQGAGANILRAVAGAGVLSGYDQMQMIMFGKKFGGGE